MSGNGTAPLSPKQKQVLALFEQVDRAFVAAKNGTPKLTRTSTKDGGMMPVITCPAATHDSLVEKGYLLVGGHKDGYRFWQLNEPAEATPPKREYKYY